MHADPAAALDRIVDRFHAVADTCQAVVVVGSDFTDVATPTEFATNVSIAANLGASVLLVVNGADRSPDDLRMALDVLAPEITAGHATLFAVVANRCDPDQLAAAAQAVRWHVASTALALFEEHVDNVAGIQRKAADLGVDLENARSLVTDVSYFGRLMVERGHADGMVSGAVHTTAHTIRPALEVVKTSPGVSVVSSVFFMCLPHQVLVYGDCAVNPDPTAEQLADIAIASARTAAAFGVEPRVAMLSYSTGSSGSGSDVDKVSAATALVRSRAAELPVEGPIQYDAAIDSAVAATKLPDSPVAGHATVFVFLNTGNNTYKAVQRSAGAVAVGPVLQGLRKPVNDLSRGATVRDIVTTIAITAIQAHQQAQL